MTRRIHITTAIFYSNATPHVGSAYEALAADVFARHQRRRLGPANVTFLSGTDEHGDKIRRAALAHGMEPRAYTDQISAVFRQAWDELNVSYDYFVRTTDPAHEKFVQEMLRRTKQRGDIYFKDYEGLYCVDCERFYTEKELLPGRLCPAHRRPVEPIAEGNYFLRLEKYRERVRDHILRNPDFIRPERYRRETLNMLAEPLPDLCISRPKSRLDWGIEVPFDPGYVTYVWYDAFWAYLSEPATANPGFVELFWPNTEHFIGKDILKTHAVYWPPILMAAGMELPRRLNVHGWLSFAGERMSKSAGNVRDPVAYQRTFGPDVLRYFVMREIVYGLDGEFSEERLVERYNADLANDLGNLVSRLLAMATRYLGGEVRAAPTAYDPACPDETVRRRFGLEIPRFGEQAAARLDDLDFKAALELIWRALDTANKYIVVTEPFTLARDPARMPEVVRVLADLLEALRVIADALEPFMPVTARRIMDLLQVDERTARAPFGEGLKPGHRVKPPLALFPRIDRTAAAPNS